MFHHKLCAVYISRTLNKKSFLFENLKTSSQKCPPACLGSIFFFVTSQDRQEFFLKTFQKRGGGGTQKGKCGETEARNCSFTMFLLLSTVHGGTSSHTVIAKIKKGGRNPTVWLCATHAVCLQKSPQLKSRQHVEVREREESREGWQNE